MTVQKYRNLSPAELAARVIKIIKKDTPRCWDWDAAGYSACFADWTASLPVSDGPPGEPVAETAMRALGLDAAEAARLFSPDLTSEEILATLAGIADNLQEDR